MWNDLPLSLLGHIHQFKMDSFARLLYPLQMLPLILHRRDLMELNKALTKFLWRSKKPRIRLERMSLPKEEGGMNLPSIKLYNNACLLRHSCDWILGKLKYSNFHLEQASAQPQNLTALLHVPPTKLPETIKHHILFRDSINAWRDVRKVLRLPSSHSFYTPLSKNPNFHPSSLHEAFDRWAERGLRTIHQLFHEPTLKPKNILQNTAGIGAAELPCLSLWTSNLLLETNTTIASTNLRSFFYRKADEVATLLHLSHISAFKIPCSTTTSGHTGLPLGQRCTGIGINR